MILVLLQPQTSSTNGHRTKIKIRISKSLRVATLNLRLEWFNRRRLKSSSQRQKSVNYFSGPLKISQSSNNNIGNIS